MLDGFVCTTPAANGDSSHLPIPKVFEIDSHLPCRSPVSHPLDKTNKNGTGRWFRAKKRHTAVNVGSAEIEMRCSSIFVRNSWRYTPLFLFVLSCTLFCNHYILFVFLWATQQAVLRLAPRLAYPTHSLKPVDGMPLKPCIGSKALLSRLLIYQIESMAVHRRLGATIASRDDQIQV